MPTIHPNTLEKLDAAGVDLWKRRNGWAWAHRAALKAVTDGNSAAACVVAGPFPSLTDAARDACAKLQIQ